MKISTLTIEMAANVARLRQDMDRAQKTVDSAMGGITKAVKGAAVAFAALGVGLSVSAVSGWVRGAIDAADASAKLARSAGIAGKEVAGLSLAFRQSGLTDDDLMRGMSRLNKEIAEGSKAFTAMGLSTRNVDGSLKGARQMLGEVADKFKSYEEGAAKAALAGQIFGERLGPRMASLLSLGSDGLAAFDDMAQKLGLTMSDETQVAAEQFNDTLDLIGQSGQGVARQIAAQMLPTLNTLAGELFRSMTEGDKLAKVSNVLAGAMKGLYSVAVGVVNAFQTVGKAIGGVGAAIAAILSGDFGQVKTILSDMRRDITDNWQQAGAGIQRVWVGAGDAGVTALAAITKATAPAIEQTKKLGNETKKLADEAKRAADEYKALYDQEMRQLKAAEELYGEKMKLARELREYEDAQLKAQAELEKKAAKEAQDAIDKQIKQEEDAYLDMWKSVDETAKDVFTDVANGGQDAFERIGKTLKAAVLDMLYQMTVRKWIFQIAGVDVGGMGGMGGGGGSNLASSALKSGGQYATNAWGNYVGGGNSGALLGGATGTMSAANVYGSFAANAATAGAATSGIAASGAGIDALLATNAAYGTATASAAGTAAASGAATGASAGVTAGLAAVPVWGWIALAVLALWEPMFGRKTKEIGKAGNFDGAGGINTSQYTQKQGGWFRSDKTYYDPLNDGGAFQNQLKGVQDGMIETARVMGLGEDAIRNFAGSININLKGLNAEEAAAKTKEEITKLRAQMLATASFTPQVTQSLEDITASMVEMGYTAEQAAAYAREVTARDDGLKRQGFEQMTNYYIGLINQTEEVMARAGITSQALADVITAGMTGRLDESQVGAQLADIVLGGIYNTIAGGFAAQISDVFMQQIIQPIMMSVTAGVPLASAISSQAMQTVVATAQNAAAQLTAIFSDPTFRQTMAQLQTVIGSIASVSVKPARSIRSFGSAALAAGEAASRAADEQRRLAEQIKAAWQQISDSITDEIRRIRGEILGMTPAGQAYAEAQFAIATAQARAGDQEAAKLLPQLSQAVLRIAEQTATSLGDLRSVQGATLASLTDTRQILSSRFGLNIPAFADGGMHGGGWAMVGERGPELAYMPPARIYNASDTQNMMGGAEVAQEIRALRAEVVTLRAITQASTASQINLEQGMRNVTNNFNQMRTKESAT